MKVDEEARRGSLRSPSLEIRLVVSDMDRTFLRSDGDVAPSTLKALKALEQANVPVCLVSSRPFQAMQRYVALTGVGLPYAAMNGAVIVGRDSGVVLSHSLSPAVVQAVYDMFSVHDVDQWFFSEKRWFVHNAGSAYVPLEQKMTGIAPEVIRPDALPSTPIMKITGSGSNYSLLARMEVEIGSMLVTEASVTRSAPWFLDITHKDANKGQAVLEIARLMNVPISSVACIGDMDNDVPMFDVAGLAVAMGNATGEVASHAHFTSASMDSDGWAEAVESFILPRVAGTRR
jgi:Cof subfamily protein (haloacid dehalogenase superfamily)